MDYSLIIFMFRKEIVTVEITDDGECDNLFMDENSIVNYSSIDDFADYKDKICDTYNVDDISEIDADAIIINCGASSNSVLSLLETLKEFKNIDCIDVKKLLPIVVQNKGLVEFGSKNIVKIMNAFYTVKCDNNGVIKISNSKMAKNVVEIAFEDFAFLFFFKTVGLNTKNKSLNIGKTKFNDNDRKTTSRFSGVAIGDVVKLGKYYKENKSKKEDIEWIVLEVEEKRALLLSKYGIDTVPFDLRRKTNIWEKSYIRDWLNRSFFQKAFNEEETTFIVDTNTEQGVNDRVFLLSTNELEQYFVGHDDSVIKCKATNYAKSKGANVYEDYSTYDGFLELEPPNGNCYWWLRTPCTNELHVYVVSFDGDLNYYVFDDKSIYTYGGWIDQDDITVRPALWVKL